MAVEFDTHGDRQCQAQMGGTDCLIRSYPVGYGLKSTDTVETVFDVNDVR